MRHEVLQVSHAELLSQQGGRPLQGSVLLAQDEDTLVKRRAGPRVVKVDAKLLRRYEILIMYSCTATNLLPAGQGQQAYRQPPGNFGRGVQNILLVIAGYAAYEGDVRREHRPAMGIGKEPDLLL